MGQYSKNTGTTSGRWGNWIAPFSFGCGGTTVALPGKAFGASPTSPSTNVSRNADLEWTAGSGATSHDVYFGTDSTPDNTESKGNQLGTGYVLGQLEYNTTYYWRIDEVNTDGTTSGDVWSFTTELPPPVEPGQASGPDPKDGASGVPITTSALSWTAGLNAVSHNVHFGADTLPDGFTNQSTTSFNPGSLVYGKTYHWRIDEINGSYTTVGPEWTFTVEEEPPQPALVGTSENNGKTWTAIVSGTDIGTLGGIWDPAYGATTCSPNQCRMDSIPKKESQVTFDPVDDAFGEPVVILKP
jgi:hypothetical protein